MSHQLNTNPYPAAFLNYRATMRLAEITIEGSTYVECGSLLPSLASRGGTTPQSLSTAL